MRRALLGIIVAAGAVPTWAYAQSLEDRQRAACTGDVMQFCSMHIPDRQRIAGCLMQNRASISPACRSTLAAATQPETRKQTKPTRRETARERRLRQQQQQGQ